MFRTEGFEVECRVLEFRAPHIRLLVSGFRDKGFKGWGLKARKHAGSMQLRGFEEFWAAGLLVGGRKTSQTHATLSAKV